MAKKIPLFVIGIPEDESSSGLIISKFNSVLIRLEKAYSKIDEARLRIKMTRASGKRKYFEVTAVIVTLHKTHVYKEKGWDLSNACENLGQRLLQNLSKRRKTRSKDSIRKIQGKMF